MTMPINLVLVRHGQSEGNIANRKSRKGDHSAFEIPEHINRGGSDFRLTDLGIEQAKKAGEWLQREFPEGFERCYVSTYVRAQETAYLLGIKNAIWNLESNLRERDWGDLDNISEPERQKRYEDLLLRREFNALNWRPPNGETLLEVKPRIDRLLSTLHRECENINVLVVCHGEVMRIFRYLLERMTDERYFKVVNNSKNPHDKIHNCQILQYTRKQVDNDGVILDRLNKKIEMMRSVWPYDMEKSRNTWEKIIRPKLTNEDLKRMIEKYPRIITS